jgi:hypothetical protein
VEVKEVEEAREVREEGSKGGKEADTREREGRKWDGGGMLGCELSRRYCEV